jgi:hypothetical protein
VDQICSDQIRATDTWADLPVGCMHLIPDRGGNPSMQEQFDDDMVIVMNKCCVSPSRPLY